MTIHPPKYITSSGDLGVNTVKTIRKINDSVSIGTEVWGEMKEPWHEGSTIIAKPGYSWVTKWEVDKPYITTKFKDEDGRLVGVYCDVSTPVLKEEDGFSFQDMYLDVWQVSGENPVILDEDELQDAV